MKKLFLNQLILDNNDDIALIVNGKVKFNNNINNKQNDNIIPDVNLSLGDEKNHWMKIYVKDIFSNHLTTNLIDSLEINTNQITTNLIKFDNSFIKEIEKKIIVSHPIINLSEKISTISYYQSNDNHLLVETEFIIINIESNINKKFKIKNKLNDGFQFKLFLINPTLVKTKFYLENLIINTSKSFFWIIYFKNSFHLLLQE